MRNLELGDSVIIKALSDKKEKLNYFTIIENYDIHDEVNVIVLCSKILLIEKNYYHTKDAESYFAIDVSKGFINYEK